VRVKQSNYVSKRKRAAETARKFSAEKPPRDAKLTLPCVWDRRLAPYRSHATVVSQTFFTPVPQGFVEQ